MAARVHIHGHDPVDRIAPDVYGHFAEHLGRCIYGGLWVGDDDRVPTDGGIREDSLDLLTDLEMPVLRWPGGCFADDYHWRDGVGPREERPRRRNMWWTQGRENVPEDSNAFGTDEFVRLCELLGAEPYLAVNVGSGDPQEAVDWAEYCNYGGDTELAAERVANGSERAHGVTYWGVGNENWGCGGRYTPEVYAEEYRRFANYLSNFDRVMGDGGMELIACGHTTEDWNRSFLKALSEGVVRGSGGDVIDHLSVHRYYEAGPAVGFDDEQYYRLFARARQVARDVDRAVDAIGAFAPEGDVGVIVDEWGVWHPGADYDNGLEQANTVRDALTAAGVLDDLNARADVVTMANIAQTVNVLQCVVRTDTESAWATPTYEVFDLYKPHMGATALRTVVDSEVRAVDDEAFDVPMVSASASRSDDGVFLTLSNRDPDAAREVGIDLDADDPTVAGTRTLFAGRDVDERSTGAERRAFAPTPADVAAVGDDGVVVEAPAASVVAVDFDVE